jgi:hypothetical protein
MEQIIKNTKITSTDINNLISELNGKLNLSGGTLNGRLEFSQSGSGGGYIYPSDNTFYVGGRGQDGKDSSFIRFYGLDSDSPGSFVIHTRNNDGGWGCGLFGNNEGKLWWNNNEVLTTASGKAIDSAKADYATTYLDSLGQKTSITSSGTTGNSTNDEILYRGLSVFGCYNTSGCPSNYGNIVQVKDARSQPGGGQLFLGWSGSDSTTEKCYYRSHRDTTGGGWGPWRELYMANTLSEIAFANGTKIWIA